MKKRIKRRRYYLIRPTEALLPMAFLAGDLFGPKALQGWLFTGWFTVRLLGLFAAEGVRMAFATQPGVRKVRGSTTLAILLQIIGAVLAAGIYALIFHGITPFTLAVIGIGLMLNIEHVFCEYLRAEGDGYSAGLCSLLTAVFFLAGVLLESAGVPVKTLILTAAGCLISILIAVFTGGCRPGRMNAAVLKHAPEAIFGGIAYPAAIAAALYAASTVLGKGAETGGSTAVWAENGLRIGFFAGLALIQVVKTPFRRSGLESRVMRPVMAAVAAVCAAAAVCACCIEGVQEHVSAAILTACGCVILSAVVSLALWVGFRKAE